jgi:hypothetical protein
MNGFDLTFTGTIQDFTITSEGYLISLGANQQVRNTAFGEGALDAITTGTDNTAYGRNSGSGITSGNFNTCVGSEASPVLSTGIYNTYVGYKSGSSANGDRNVGLGGWASILEGGDRNTSVGYEAGYYHTSNDFNVFFGDNAGSNIVSGATNTTSSQGTFLGARCRPLANGGTNEICVGYLTYGNGSNTATWGNTSITDHYFNGTINNTGSGSTVSTVNFDFQNSSSESVIKGFDDSSVEIGNSGDRVTIKNILNVEPVTASTASAYTASNGDIVYVSTTDATFTSIGIWAYEGGAWVKL